MHVLAFTDRSPGKLVSVGIPRRSEILGFVPDPLPPTDLVLSTSTQILLESAATLLGRLAGVGEELGNQYLLINPLMRRDAIASNEIEGTVTTPTELLLFEALGGVGVTAPEDRDAEEVLDYVRAMQHGLELIQDRPITLTVIRDMHRVLMQRSRRGGERRPGEFRIGQNHIRGEASDDIADARFVPPPVLDMQLGMNQLEVFINNDEFALRLVRLALIHYQFETIHPFRDGNGRVGRLLIPLLLCKWNLLPPVSPLLYVSGYFAKHKKDYQDLLLQVSQRGEWEPWIRFFLNAVQSEASRAWNKARQIKHLHRRYREQFCQGTSRLGVSVFDLLFERPVVQVKDIEKAAGVSHVTAGKYVTRLVKEGVLVPLNDRKWGRTYYAQKIISLVYEDGDSLQSSSDQDLPGAPPGAVTPTYDG